MVWIRIALVTMMLSAFDVLGPVCVFFGEVSIQVLCPFLIGLFVFQLLGCESSLCILGTQPLSDL